MLHITLEAAKKRRVTQRDRSIEAPQPFSRSAQKRPTATKTAGWGMRCFLITALFDFGAFFFYGVDITMPEVLEAQV